MAEWWEQYTAQPAPKASSGNWWDAFQPDFGNVESGVESRPSFAGVQSGVETTARPLMSSAQRAEYQRLTEAGVASGEIPRPIPAGTQFESRPPTAEQILRGSQWGGALNDLTDSPVAKAIRDNPLIRGFEGRLNEAAAGANLLTAMPVATAVDALRGDNAATDYAGQMIAQHRARAAELAAPADAPTGQKVVQALGSLAFDLPTAMASKPLEAASALPRFLAATDTAVAKQLLGDAFKEAAMTARIPATASGMSTALSVIDNGGTPDQAIKAGLAEAAGTVGNFALPLNIAGNLPSRLAQGAGANVAGEAAQNALVNQFLPADQQRELYDPEQMLISAAIGAPMAGVLGEPARQPARVARAAELTNELAASAGRIRTPESDAVDAGRETARAIFAEADAAARPDPATNVPETVLDNSPEFSNQNRARLAELEAKPEPTLFEREEMALLQEGKPFDRQALLADLESAPEPELIRNGTRVFYPGDVKTMRAKLAEAGLSEGMRMTGEDGSDVGLYFPARLRAEVDAVLRPKPAEQAQPEPVKEGELPYRELGIPPPRKPRNRVKSAADFDPNYHDIRDFIALHGGLDAKAFAAEFNSEVPSPAENFRFFGKPLFRKSGGLQPDQLRELLQETGFLNPDSMDGVARYTPQDAYDLVDRALDGNPVYHSDGVATQNAIQNYNNEYADLSRRQEYIDEHGVTPELDEEFARRADAMDRGDLEPVFSKRAKDRTATPDMFGATQRAQTTPTPRPASGDLFGAPTSRERLDAAQRDSDARLTGPAVGMRQGDGELFAGPRPRQETIPPRSSSAPSDPTSWILRDKATGKAVMETADRRKVDALNTQKYEAVPAEQHMQEVNTKGTLAYDAARGSGIKRSQRPAESILPVEDMRTAPLGAWVRGNKVPGVREADLFQVMDVPLDRINAPELDSSDNIAPERRLDAEDYTNRLRNGEVAPNARGYELPSGLIKLADGHRRMIAARNAGRDTLRIAVSPIDQEGVKQRLERPDAQGIEVDEAADLTPEELAAFSRQVDTGRGQADTSRNDRRTSPSNADSRRDGARRTVEDQGGRSGQPVPVQDGTFAPDASLDASSKPPKFPRWFRQSKLKNPKGIPLEFNHTTNADFDTFDSSRRGSNTGYAPSGLGNWFSQSVEGYGSKKLTGNIRMENPKVMPLHKLPDLDTQEDFAAYADKLRDQGFDGIYFPDVKQAVTFDSVQFKENDNTEYSESPNIFKSQRKVDPQTETPAFKKWFGDSKVVDENGEPMVVYHGTNGKFDTFETGRKGYRAVMFDETEIESQGMFFSSSESDAKGYGRNVIPAYLSVKRPFTNPNDFAVSSRSQDSLDASKKAWEDAEYILQPLIYERDGRTLVDYNNGISAVDVDTDGEWVGKLFVDGKIDWDVLDNPEVVARMKELGYDGAQVYEGNDEAGESWFVVNPTQIKSATGNSGDFDATNPSILKSAGKQKSAPKRLSDAEVAKAKADAESRVASHWGRSAVNKLKTRGRVEFITKQEVLDQNLGNKELREDIDTTDGFYDQKSGIAYVIADSNTPISERPGVFVHELFHANGEKFLGSEGFTRLKDAFRKLRTRDKEIDAAYKRAEAVNTVAEHLDEEGIAYLAQEAPKHRLSERLTDEAKLFLNRLGIPLDWLNAHAAAVRKIAALNLKDAANRGGVVSFNKDGVKYQKVFHGTPHRGIEKDGFKLNKIGTGEGAQAFGYGMYFAGNKDIAEHYRNTLSSSMADQVRRFALDEVEGAGGDIAAAISRFKRVAENAHKIGSENAAIYDRGVAWLEAGMPESLGQLYHAEIPEDSDLLDWDKPLSEQPEKVREALVSAEKDRLRKLLDWRLQSPAARDPSSPVHRQIEILREEINSPNLELGGDGRRYYIALTQQKGSPQAASEYLQSIGIPGLRYRDGGSRGQGQMSYQDGLPAGFKYEKDQSGVGIKNEKGLWLTTGHRSEADAHRNLFGPRPSHNYVIWDETLLTPEKAQITPYYSKRDKPKPKVTGARPEELIEVRKQISSFRTLIKCLGG